MKKRRTYPSHPVALTLASLLLCAPALWSQTPLDDGMDPAPGTDLLAYTEEFQRLLGEEPALGAAAPEAEPPAPSLFETVMQLRGRADALVAEAEAIQGPAPPSPAQREASAAQHYETTGEAPIVATPVSRSFPFGHATPEVTCVPQRVCDIELEPGERYIDHRSGDNLNWEIVPGPQLPDHLPDHVALRPRDFGLHTNLVLYTTHRTYHLRLRSPEEMASEQEGGTYAFDQSVRFYYPDDWVARKRAERQEALATGSRPVPSPTAEPLALSPTHLNAAYTVQTPRWKKRRLPWRPVTVFDDGERTFLALPPEARNWDLPALLGILPGGESYPLNPTLRDDWIIVPTLFTEAELRLGTGDQRRFLRLRNDRLYHQLPEHQEARR
jgi:type IV secretion system protein VirB9